MQLKTLKKAVAAAALAGLSSMASADLIATIEGNDCAGVFGTPFASCQIPAEYDQNQTPIIIKFDFGDDLTWTTEINSGLFPTIDGSEFSFVFDDDEGRTGTWTYNPGDGDPGINFFTAKGGNFFNLFSNLGDPNSDNWLTPINPANQQRFGLSHLAFYDTFGRVPEPASLLLLAAGLLALRVVGRRARPA